MRIEINDFNNPVNVAGLLVHDLGSLVSQLKNQEPKILVQNIDALHREWVELSELIHALQKRMLRS